MIPRRRQFMYHGNNNESGDGKPVEDEEPFDIPDEIMKLYDDSDNDDPGPPLREYIPRKKRTFVSEKANQIVFLMFMGVLVYVIHVATKKQVNKLKSEIGFEDPKAPPPELWWNHALFYYVFPRSFQDSNGDGIGDIQGILDRISHFEFLRVNGVVLGPMFQSAMMDAGNDITDFQQIDPIYGTVEDFEKLIEEFHERDIKVILELVPNHTSDKHKWFLESCKGGASNNYSDYYVWHPGKIQKDGIKAPPSNWISHYGGPAWSWQEDRGEFYLHQYHRTMPDLNHRHPDVRRHMIDIFSFWISKGIDGIRMQGVNVLFEVDDITLNEPVADEDSEKPKETRKDLYGYLDHIYTDDQPEIHEFMATWRELVEEYFHLNKKKLFLTLDCDDEHVGDIIKHYETGADAPFNYFLSRVDAACDARCLHQIVDEWLMDLPDGRTTLWMLSSPEHGRLVSRKGALYGRALAAVQLLLPGSPVIYYGEEIGMEDAPLTYQQTLDLRAKYVGQDLYERYSRDPCRTPMQWTAEKHGGFSSAETTWLPVHGDHAHRNVKVQLQKTESVLLFYKALGVLREENDAFKYGGIKYAFTNDAIFSFIRYSRDQSPFLVIVNIGSRAWTEDFTLTVGMALGRVALYHSQAPRYKQGETIDLSNIALQPGDVIVFKLF